ncbi:DNA polymerase delta catalytic subunit [Orchesella cincta]|uniref:DNA polymerase delta catalytic subunit n=1 Tax=Orchesella cincta TaxID=48709 RepID=A0A1D2MMM9_ORCCI|nr:DNA polymerase delta catalytic subunit [Orchesella cincta]
MYSSVKMEVLNISCDDNDEDTSGTELDEDPDFLHAFPSLSSSYSSSSAANRTKHITKEVVDPEELAKLFKEWERPPVPEGMFYSSTPVEAQPEAFRFLFLDSVSSISAIRHPSIELEEQLVQAPFHTIVGVARVPAYSSSQDLFDEPDFMDPKCFQNDHAISVCCNELEQKLNEKVSTAVLNDFSLVHVHDYITNGFKPVVRIEGVEFCKVENSIFHFPTSRNWNKKALVLKIFVALPMFVTVTAKIVDNISDPCSFQNFETSITNNIRFLTDQKVNIPGCTWLELPAGKHFLRNENDGAMERESHCQVELDIHFCDISKLANQPTEIPPLRVLSFDLECRLVGTDNKHGQSALTELQVSFRDFVIQMDPDIITGYNIKNFDLPYLIGRAEKYYHTFEDSKRFAFMGRLKKIKTTIRPIINQHKQMNRLDKQIVNIQGRIVMDMFPLYVIHDVTRTGVKPLALKSVQMPDRASAKMDFLQYYFEKSRLGGTILRYLVNKSRDYDKYFKQVRVQRNDGRVKYHPDSPEFKKLQESGKPTNKVKTICKLKNCNRTLFTDD